MKTILLAFTGTVLLVLGSQDAAAQPGCRYSYFMSLDCPNVSGDVVVLGRVIRLTEIDRETGVHTDAKDLGSYPQGEVVIEVEEVLKGNPEAFIGFTVSGTCYGVIEQDRKYIFNLDKTSNGYANPKWSNWLPFAGEGKLEEFLSAHRALIRGERLSTLFGTLRAKDDLAPIEGVTVVAEKDGVKFELVTDSKGRYDFSKLPEGDYKVQPVFGHALRPAEHSERPHAKPGDTARILQDNLCGVRLDFFASHNGVISGRIEDADGKPIHGSTATLWRVDTDSKYTYKPSIKQNEWGPFSFVDLPPGRYVIEVMINRIEGPISFYYPGTLDEKEALIIDLERGQEVKKLVFKLPPH